MARLTSSSSSSSGRRKWWPEMRADITTAVGEFIGTFVFILLGLGGVQSGVQASSDNVLFVYLYISASMGLALLFSAWMFYRATGAAFNPNISFALLLLGVIKPKRFVLYCIAQFLGALAATAILSGLTPGPLLVAPQLAQGVSIAQGLFIEMFGTMALILSVLLLAIEKHTSSFLAPIGIGLCLFSVHLWAVQYTGSGVNTARAFAPCVVQRRFDSYHWIYWVGPTLGAVVIDAIYLMFKHSNKALFDNAPAEAAAVAMMEQARDLAGEVDAQGLPEGCEVRVVSRDQMDLEDGRK